jgi:hypothetical protein
MGVVVRIVCAVVRARVRFVCASAAVVGSSHLVAEGVVLTRAFGTRSLKAALAVVTLSSLRLPPPYGVGKEAPSGHSSAHSAGEPDSLEPGGDTAGPSRFGRRAAIEARWLRVFRGCAHLVSYGSAWPTTLQRPQPFGPMLRRSLGDLNVPALKASRNPPLSKASYRPEQSPPLTTRIPRRF